MRALFYTTVLATAFFGAAPFVDAQGISQSVAQSDEPVYIESDTLIENSETGAYIARGNVIARQNGRTVSADELEFRPETNRVIARGNVSIFSDNAPPQYADEIELDDALGEALATGFSTLLENNGRAAAAFAVRRSNGSLELTNAYYTACRICENGDEPTWRLRAARAVQDTDEGMIYYRDVRLEIMGVPVAYAPAFAHADPSAERRSGFLFPAFGGTSRLGAFYAQPYYWAISPHHDLTITPMVTQNTNPLLGLEYRRRFWSGDLTFEGSYTNERDIDSDGNRFNDAEDRWHLFGGGEFDINEDWEWGFGVQLASDDFHLRVYEISEDYDDYPGIIQPAPRRLMNQLFARGRTDDYYAEIFAAGVQSLREFENNDALPIMAPVGEFRLTTPLGNGMGRIRSVASTSTLVRDFGPDYFRATVSADWENQYISPQGLVLEPFANVRGDYFNYGELNSLSLGRPNDQESFGQFLGYAGAELSFPMIRSGAASDTIVEPIIQGVIASDTPDQNFRLIEDSLTVELDETLLFDGNRTVGYDLWEEGSRLAYGVRSTTFWGENNRLRTFVGQSQRLDGDNFFLPGSGLDDDSSDIIVAGEVDLGAFSAGARTRIDPNNGELNRIDFVASYFSDAFSGTVRYFDFNEDLNRFGTNEEIQITTRTRLTDYWSLVANLQRDLDAGVNRRQEIGLLYRDFCTEFEVLYQRDNINIGALGPSESIQFRITFFTLGGVGGE